MTYTLTEVKPGSSFLPRTTANEEFQAILNQIEAELCHSDLYQRIAANLQTLPTDLGHRIQRMMQAIAREAIRTTARNLVTHPSAVTVEMEPVAPAAPPVTEAVAAASPSPRPNPDAPPAPPIPPASRRPAATVTTLGASTNPVATKSVEANKRLSKREKLALASRQAWEAQVQHIGQQLHQCRVAKSISLDSIHLRTQIPMHQLEALENGQLERLPEAVYVQGFIRQIGDMVGLDGKELVHSLPQLDITQTLLPSWQKPQTRMTGIHVHPAYFYVGYAALLAGGMSWVSYRMSTRPVSETPTETPAVVVAPIAGETTKRATPATTEAMPLPANIAPPELQR